MADLLAVAVAAGAAALLAVPAPRVVASLPEPAAVTPAGGLPDGLPDEPPKVPYADLAATPGLRVRLVVAAGLVGAVLGAALGWRADLLLWVPLVPLGVVLAWIDWRTRLLPRLLVLPGVAAVLVLAGAVAAASGEADALLRGLVGLVASFCFYWLLWWIHAAGMGFGDVRLSAVTGFLLGHLGWAELLVGSYLPFLLLAVPGLTLAVVRRDRRLLKAAYPFGPAMLAGAALGVVLAPWLAGGLATG
ncbi:prepilin peptidase [Nocardioides sp. GCM10027113]|uniref:prepilin peptidase n=1 Tax=unclassified Nocardioides TaxID=2615069 RepID=UPI00360745EB